MDVKKEMKEAESKYGHFNSTHEVYGVLVEEVAEFFDLVREKPGTPGKASRMIYELNQIAAVSLRAAKELSNHQIKHV